MCNVMFYRYSYFLYVIQGLERTRSLSSAWSYLALSWWPSIHTGLSVSG